MYAKLHVDRDDGTAAYELEGELTEEMIHTYVANIFRECEITAVGEGAFGGTSLSGVRRIVMDFERGSSS
jgi:hypothetical protein